VAIIRGQKTGYDCGPTCFANTLNILGYDIKIKQANKLCNLKKEGTDSDDLIKAFDKYGFEGHDKVYYDSQCAWNWLVKNTNRGVPTIISVDYDLHWILVLLAGKNKAQILDPEDSLPSLISRKELIERWGCLQTPRSNSPRFHSLELIPYKNKSIQAIIVRERLITTMGI
jgi:ABC-type bacteriocin/lantibiotic exporter with double-glycine peptidase domain